MGSSSETAVLGHGILGQVNEKSFRYPLLHLGIEKRFFMSTYFTLKLVTPIMLLVTLKKKVQGGGLCNKILFLKVISQAYHYKLTVFFTTCHSGRDKYSTCETDSTEILCCCF